MQNLCNFLSVLIRPDQYDLNLTHKRSNKGPQLKQENDKHLVTSSILLTPKTKLSHDLMIATIQCTGAMERRKKKFTFEIFDKYVTINYFILLFAK